MPTSKDGKDSSLWDLTETEEGERIREFWLGLGDAQRRSLARVDKDCMWKKLEQKQKQECVCRDCRRKKTAELKASFKAFCRQLELDERRHEHVKASRCVSEALTVKGRCITVDHSVLKGKGVHFWDTMELLSQLPCTFRCEPVPPSDCSAARNVGDEKKQVPPTIPHNVVKEHTGEDEERDGADIHDVQEDNADDSGTLSPSGSAQECPIDSDERSLETPQELCGATCPAMFFRLAAEMLQDCVVRKYRERLALERQERLIWEFEEEERLAADRRKSARLEKKKQRRRGEKLNKTKKTTEGEGAEREQQDEAVSEDRSCEAEKQQQNLQKAQTKKKKKKRSKKKAKSCKGMPVGEGHKEEFICENFEVQQCRSIVPSVLCGSTVARARPCHYTVSSAHPSHCTGPSAHSCHSSVPRVQPCHYAVPRVQPCHHTAPRIQPCHHTVPRVQPCHHAGRRAQPCHSDVAGLYPCHSTMASFLYKKNECTSPSDFVRPDVTFVSDRAREVERALAKMIDDLLA
mmetsp:Transcript_3347/g.11770  ORF Transcript_3347/g.11770 Transcript_3347/m.11770 type:complete len:519 (+) Transcript_3347:396-1952(+)